MLKQILIPLTLLSIGFADTIVITPSQTGVLTHSFQCCGYNLL